MDKVLIINDKTKSHLKKILNDKVQDSFLRIKVTSGGCAGFQYYFKVDCTLSNNDIKICIDQIVILIDKISLSIIKGSHIDYLEELIGSKLIIKNLKSSFSCGCGSSFSM